MMMQIDRFTSAIKNKTKILTYNAHPPPPRVILETKESNGFTDERRKRRKKKERAQCGRQSILVDDTFDGHFHRPRPRP